MQAYLGQDMYDCNAKS